MSAVISRIVIRLAAIFLVGLVIKLTDDYLDEDDYDKSNNRTMAGRLGKGMAAYGLLLFALAVSLDAGTACTLFLAAYAVGMFKDPALILPTYFPAWGESLLVVLGGILLWGGPEMLSAVTIMTAVQLADDYWDQELDRQQQRSNLAQRWGRTEVLLLTVLTVLISLLLDWEKALLTFFLIPVINIISVFNRRGGVTV